MSARGEGEGAPADNLAAYRAKRSADRSPEPVGTVATAPGRLFVVHKHAARQLHFDLRLEMEGVLRSWAVPRGPSYDTNDKRLAVKVEDHPLEYGDFEGVIPDGNYGAGGVIVWDRGEWVPLEDPIAGLEKGKLLFDLKGYKLHGKWTLVKIKKGEKEWLLIKERDGWVKSPGDQFPEISVLSGLTVEEVKAGQSPAAALRVALSEAGVARGEPLAAQKVDVQLAEARDTAFTSPEWLFELKMDGYRMLGCKQHGEPLLLTRKGNDYTHVFPEVARAIKAIPAESCIVDGEVVVLNPKGTPSFSLLQQRGRISSSIDIKRLAVELPATFFAFDLLAFEDFDTRPLPLRQRKEFLSKLLPKLGPVRFLDHIDEQGEAFLAQVTAMELEGIIAKKGDAPYRGGRSPQWLKIKADRTGDFVIVGFTEPKGGRGGFGALQLADRVGDQLVYAGRAGTGFNAQQLADIRDMLEADIRKEPPCFGPVALPGAEAAPSEAIPETRTTTWVEPRYVCEVRFTEWTHEGLLRHPAFLRLRNDKGPHDCERQGWDVGLQTPDATSQAATAEEDAKRPTLNESVTTREGAQRPTLDESVTTREGAQRPTLDESVTTREGAQRPTPDESVTTREGAQRPTPDRLVTFSNLKKVFWPEEKYTKGDLIDYYRDISPWLLPYLKNRPVVLTRYPDGIDGKSFYQKDAPEFAPEWIRTVPIWSNDTQRDIRYFVCEDEETLLYLANSASIPLHIWASRVGSLELPDWCVIDLDPKEAPFSDVIRCAQVLHRICGEIALPHYVKTTGKTGLHILIPLGRQCTYEQSRTLGELLARLVVRELPDIATITRHITRRGDKVYIDYLQNRHGQLIVSPFSVRPLPGAPVSMPLLWEEVNDALNPRDFTIRNATARMESLGSDPVRAVLEEKADLVTALGRLAALQGP